MARVETYFTHSFKFSPVSDVSETEVAETLEFAVEIVEAKPDWLGGSRGGEAMARLMPFGRRPGRSDILSGDTEDAVIINRLAAGDEQALGWLMDRYGGQLLHFAHRLVGDMQLAEEIFQDTMLKAWQQAAQFRLDGHLKAWLFRVARNNAIDHMRKKRFPVEEYTTAVETATTTDRPEREAEKSWLSAEVYEAIGELPLAYREVVDLRFFHQLCYNEIAQVLGIPLGTVKSRLNYAIQRLTKILQERGIDNSLLEG